jgi:hypothetical protein
MHDAAGMATSSKPLGRVTVFFNAFLSTLNEIRSRRSSKEDSLHEEGWCVIMLLMMLFS